MFYYYIPSAISQAEITREFLLASPLANVFWDLLRSPALFDGRIRTFSIHANGPDGLSGVIVAAMPAAGLQGPPPGIRPGQAWQKVCAPDSTLTEYWIGYDEATPPTPEGLRREFVVPGLEHELGDGQIWTCPIVRRQGLMNGLPSRWGLDPASGEYRSTMLPRYASAWEAAGRIFNAQISGEISLVDAVKLCAEMLAINYRVSVHEVSILGLLDDTTWRSVWRSATDADFLEEWMENQQKKSDGS